MTDTVAAANAPRVMMNCASTSRGAPLEMVLDLPEQGRRLHHRFGDRGERQGGCLEQPPTTKDEAVAVLDSALNRNGYAAIRNGGR